MEVEPPPSVWAFLMGLRGHWMDAMSGAASVPFAIAAVYAPSKFAQVLLALAAITCAWFAAYRTWSAERRKVTDLQSRVDIVAAHREQTAALREQTEENRLSRLGREAKQPKTISVGEAIVKIITESVPRQIALEVGSDGSFATTKLRDLYSIKRTLQLRIENTDAQKPLTGCKVQITTIEPYPGSDGPWLVADGIDIAGGDAAYVPIARYGEAIDREKFNSADSFFLVCLSSGREPTLAAEGVHFVTIRVTSMVARFEEINIALLVDGEGHLRANEFVPIKEAAIEVYERLDGTSIFVEITSFGKTPSGITRWMMWQLVARGHAWGRKWPSNEMVRITAGSKGGLEVINDDGDLGAVGQREPLIREVCVMSSEIEEYIEYAGGLRKER